MLLMIIRYIKIEGNYYYDKHETNFKQCVNKEEESMLLISRAKFSKVQS